MDAKKLDKWANLLLDTGKRNNLISYKDTKNSTVEALFPSAADLFDRIDESLALEVFDPKINEEDEDDAVESPSETDQSRNRFPVGLPGDGSSKEQNVASVKAAFLDRYAGLIKRRNQILLFNPTTSPLAAVKNIDKKAREFVQETGVNVAYMAFGFIHWKESDTSNFVFCAPVLLVPIKLERASAVDPFVIRAAEDDCVVNPTFAYKLEVEYGIKLPEYDDEGLTAYLEKVRYLVAKLNWTVTEECKVGLFSFLKINMYRDLKDNAAAILANQNIRQLLGEPIDSAGVGVDDGTVASVSNPLIELHSVVDADSSQIEAIEMAKAGRSFVLQGPPGTGKSQTITNIIAECLGDGKRVLFVSEKLAALNVVYDKLIQAGLAEFCLQLHSHKANKKDVIADICHTLRSDRSAVSSKADAEISAKEKAQRQLDAYAMELHRRRPGIEKSLYQLYEVFAAFRSMPDVEWIVPQLSSKGESYMAETVSLLEQYVDYIPSVGYDYKKNPWYGYINQDLSYQTKMEMRDGLTAVVRLLDALAPLQREIAERFGIRCDSIRDVHIAESCLHFVATSRLVTPRLLNKECFEAVRSALCSLQELSLDTLAARSALGEVFDDGIYELDGEMYHKKLIKQFDGTFSRLFNSEYNQLIADLRICKKDGKKPTYDEAVMMTKRLAYYQWKSREFADAEAPVKALLGAAYDGIETDWEYLTKQLFVLETLFSNGASFGILEGFDDFASERNSLEEYGQRIRAAFASCDDHTISHVAGYFDNGVLDVYTAPCSLVSERLYGCLNAMDRLDNWCHFRELLSKLDGKQIVPYIDVAIGQNIEPGQIVGAFQKLFYFQWIDSILLESPVLSAFNRIPHDQAIAIFAEKDTEQFEINKAVIRANLSAKRPSLDMIAPGSAVATLLREGEKKRKQKSIRSLLAETGELVQLIKPCFLMSPLSVSTFLAPGSVHFDVVIFDEASQIFPQDAVGAIYRAEQLIVVGDSKQMPPSNFFNSSVEVEDNDEETGDITDFESILDLCSTSMRQLRLRWHYRSRYEQLIAFSNKNFYDSDLVTFPSSKADVPWIGVDYYHVDGTFDRRAHTNRKEAEFIVDLIYKNIEKYPERSLGVVAFSVAQQDLIDRLLSKRRQCTPEKEFFFESDGDEPFFIKNLETVQGDERDTIIFSVAYGADAQGRLLQNFGPLNRVGGERRLNVAVTRAKCNVQLVSSMRHTDIDLSRTSSEGVRLLREYLDYAENGDVALERSVSVHPFEQFDSDFELEVCDFLRSRGFTVDTQVGCSGFRIDLGLRIPNSSDYVLAIECDGATYHFSRNARDRDRLRQEILERMGWKFYRIWSTDWFRNKTVEQCRLLEAAVEAIEHPVHVTERPSVDRPTETFEETAAEEHFEFPLYKMADVRAISRRHRDDFQAIVRDTLEEEAPLSEEWLLKRMTWYFNREVVNDYVRQAYKQRMRGCNRYGIIRKGGFLYLEGKEIRFRASSRGAEPNEAKREINYIAPEELAEGMVEILRQNVAVDRTGLYRSLAAQCGMARVGGNISKAMDAALRTLEDRVVIDGEHISLR